MRKYLLAIALGVAQTVWPGEALAESSLSLKPPGDYVVLLHGLRRTSFSLKRIEASLRRDGYRVINETYPSTRLAVEEAADVWLPELLARRAPDEGVKVHFVTHSMGGIVVRRFLADHQFDRLGRVVMLGPPNGGSELVDRFKHNFLFRALLGPAGQELGTDEEDLPRKLGPAHFELGIIAGDRTRNFLGSSLIPGRDDGKVSVANTTLDGMSDFMVVHHTHTFMMRGHDVVTAVERFLANGRFAAKRMPIDQ